jgi:hypothetical protein
MNFDTNPNYNYLKSLFLNILKRNGEKNDLIFSWVDKKLVPKITKIGRNNKSNIYKNLFSANSIKMKSTENINISMTKILF